MNHDAAILSLRPDLVQRRIRMGDRFVWVLKDPLSRAFFYFSDRDHSLLQLLDGRRQIAEIIVACREKFAPDYVSAESLIAFLADAKSNGLITSSVAPRSHDLRSPTPAVTSGWKNPLAIRLPGINPDRLLDRITPLLSPIFSPLAVFVSVVLALIAAVIAVVNFDQLVTHITVAASRSSHAWVLILAMVIAFTKIIHELAHAVACKAFGAECREIGIMFLVGIPCLYCDVSDAWMLSSRWKRIIISSAGMLAELLIATLATVLWVFSTDSIIRDVCVTTMIVCSLSTVLFNGNPLLRYDGYFVLSDLLGIPNLASESSSLIRRTLRRQLWALPAAASCAPDVSLAKRSRTLFTYGFLSGTYRLLVLTLIATMIYKFSAGFGFGFVGGALATALIVSTIWRMIKPVVTPPAAIESRSALQTRRPILLMMFGGICLLFAFLIPLPRSVTAPTSVQAVGAADVFLETEGRLVSAVAADADVRPGDRIATFRNHATELELARLESVQQQLSAQLTNLRQRRSTDKEAAGKIPAVTKALDAAKQLYTAYQSESERLTVLAPCAGRVFAPRNQLRPPANIGEEHETWIETPLASESRGAVFDQGTLLCTIGDPSAREAMVLVRQQDIDLVRLGQKVDLLTQTHRRGHFCGLVTHIASSPIDAVAREFFAAGLVDPAPHNAGVGKTRNTYYQVRVQLDETDHPPVVRSTAKARIKVAPASLASRLGRLLSDSFQFQL